MENSPEEKRLQAASFLVHATRGVIRDQNTRRYAMLFLTRAGAGAFDFGWNVAAAVAESAARALALRAIFSGLHLANGDRHVARDLRFAGGQT